MATPPRRLARSTIALVAALGATSCAASDGVSDCLAQQKAMRARQQVLEARIERLEVMLSLQRPPPGHRVPPVNAGNAPADPFAAAIAQLDEPPVLPKADALLALVDQNATHPRAPEALLLSAQALLRAEEWILADWTFEKVVYGWPSSSSALPALWGRAESALAQDKHDEARVHLEALAAQRTDETWARRAREALEKIGQESDESQKRQ